MNRSLIEKDLNHIWHPCSQMKDYRQFPPVIIEKAQGSLLYTHDGQTIIDAISSWWCKSLGHRHPHLMSALISQTERLEHVILANTTNETIVRLSERLAQLMPPLNKVFYASDGSSAVEIALKLALHTQMLRGNCNRTQFAALRNGYHGETGFAMAVSDLGLYRKPYEHLLAPCHFIGPIPMVTGMDDPLWKDCSDVWPQIENHLNANAKTLGVIIVEPLIQGAGNMQIYSKDALQRLRLWAKKNDVIFIADEIMTGFGRTGHALASQTAEIVPDLICLGKGLTGGVLPMSAVLIDEAIFDLSVHDYGLGYDFLHSHTYSGNTLAAAVANACLDIYETENIYQQVRENSDYLLAAMQTVSDETQCLNNIRSLGAVVAADLTINTPRAGFRLSQTAMHLGALLRPLGNTLYWLPPLNTPLQIIDKLKTITIEAISQI